MSTQSDSQSSSQILSSSYPSLRNSKKTSTELSKVYKHASQLYLTRRLPETYEYLQPYITTPSNSNGSHHEQEDDSSESLAPVATAPISTRIKIWSLYISLLNEVLNLDSNQGREDFGSKYKSICNRVRNGDVWEEVVRDGYAGREASVDAEVIFNLTSLMLGQAPNQKLTQVRLESYLSTTSPVDLNLSEHLNGSPSRHHRPQNNGTSTPKDLNSRIRIIELFTLHVLPRNEEWDYARSFLNNSDILDEERREAFLQTLQELSETKDNESIDNEVFEDSTEELQAQQAEVVKKDAEIAVNGNSIPTGAGQHHRSGSEVDYGIDATHPNGSRVSAPSTSNGQPTPAKSRSAVVNPPPPPQQHHHREQVSRSPHPGSSSLSPPSQTPRHRPSTQKSTSNVNSSQNRLISQARHLFRALQTLIANITTTISSNPSALLRLLTFLIAFLIAFSRPEIRDRIRRAVATAWKKVGSTVGMGVKTSYI